MKKSNLRIVGFGYKISSGKDTAADLLVAEYGYTKMRFADALKEAVSAVFGWPRAKLDDQKFKETMDPFWGIAPRTALQLFGTEVGRQIRMDVWIKALELRIKNFMKGKVLPWIVVPDVRFLNEVEAIKTWGGIVVRIDRPSNDDEPADAKHKKHASETELDDCNEIWDDTLVNDRSLAAFVQLVRDWHRQEFPHK